MHTRTKLYYIVLGFTVGIIFGSLAGLSIPKVYAQDSIQCKAETAVEQVDREKANRAAKQTAKIVADAALDSSFRQVVVGIKRWILSWTYAPPSVILDSNILKKYEDQAIDEVLQIYVQNHPEVNIATIKRQLYEQAPEVVTALAQKYLDSLHLKQLTPFQVAELPNDVVMAISGQELFGISESGVRAQYTASSRALSLVGSLQNEKKDAAYRALGYIDAKGLYAANIVTGISAGHSAFGDFVLHAIGKAFFQLFSYPEYQLVRVKGDKYLVVTTTDTTYDTFITMYAKEISKTSMVYRVDGRVQKRPVEVNFEPVPDGYILPAYVQTDTRSIVGRHPLLDKYVTAIQSASFDSNVVSFLRSLLQTLYVDDVLEAGAAQLEKQYSTREKPVDITVFADWNDAIQSAQERISQDHLSVLRFDVIALLKWVNDTYGDTYGDAYIQKQFDVLVSYLVESLHMQHAVLYRRANEFYVLFDNTSENKPDAASLFDHINRTFSSYTVKDTVYQVMPIVVDVPFTTGDETLTRLGEKASVATRDFIRSYFFDKQGDPQKEISIAHWGWLHKYFYPDVLVEKRGAMRMQSLFGATAQEVAAVPIIPSSFGLFAEISPAWMQAMRQIITKVPLEPEEVVNADALEVADSTTLPSTSAPQIYDLWKMLFSFFQAKWGRLYTVRFDEDYIVHVKRGTHNDMVVQREENVQIFVQRRDVKERVIVLDTVFNLNHGDVIFFGRDVMQGWLAGIGTGNQWYFVETDANGVMLREPTVKSTNVFETTTQNVEILKINDAQSKKEAPVPLPTDVNRQTPVSVDTKKLDALRKQMIEWIITKPTIFGGWVHIETTQKELFKSYMPLVDFFLTRFGDDAALLSRMQIADSDVGPLQGVVETARSLNAISLPQRMWNSTLLPVLYASGNFVISTFEMSTLLQPGDPNNPELDRQLKRAAIAKLAELIETYPGLEGYTLVRLSDTQFAVVLNDKQKATYGSFKQFASQLESIVSGQYVVVYDSQTKRYIQTGIHIQHIEKDVVLIEQAVNLLKYENFIHDGIPSALREMKKDGVTPPPDDVMALFAVARGGALYSEVQIQQFREQNYEFRRLYDLLQNKFFAASPALQKYLIQMIITLELDDTLSSVVYKLNQEFSRGDDQVTKLRVFLNARSAILEASNRYSDPKRNNEFKVLEISLSRDGQNSEEAIRTAFENLGPYLVTHKGLNLEEAIVYHDKQTDRYFVFVNADYPVDIDKMSQGLPNATITETAIAVGKEETPDEMLAKFHVAQDTLARYQEAKKSGSTDATIRAEIKLAESTNWSLWHQLRSELSDTVHVIWAGVTGGLDWLFVKLPYHPYTHPDGTPLGAFEQFMTILSMRDPNTRVVPKDIPYQVKAGVSFKETLAPKMMAAHLLFALTSDKANYFPGQPLLFDYRTNTSAIRQQLVYPVSIALYDAKTKWWQTLTFTKTELDAFENQSVTEVEKAIRGKIDREKYSGSSKKPEHLVLALVEHGGQMQELPQEFRDAGAPVVISFDSNRTLSVLVDHIVGEGNLVRELTNAVRHALFDDLGERVVYPQILENKTNQRLTVRITDMPDNTSFDDALYPFAYAMKRQGYRAVKTMVSEGNLRDRATVGLLEIFTIPTKERITRMLEQTHAGKGVFNRLVYVYYARVWRYVEPVLTFIFEWIRGLNEFPRALKGPLISFIKGDFEGDPGLLTTILSDYDKNTPTLVILQDKKTGKTRFILQGVKDVWVREQMIRDMEAYFNVRVHGDAPLEWQELTSEQKKASRAKTEIYQPTFANKIIPAQQISQGIRPTSMPTNAQRIGLRENGYFWIGSDATSVVGVREAGGVDMYIERRNAPKGTRERVDQFFTVTHGDAIYFGNDMTGWRIARGGADQLVIIPLDKKGTEVYEEERDEKTYPLYLEFKNIVVPPEGVRQSVPAKVEEQQPLATPMPEQTKQRVNIAETQTGDGGVQGPADAQPADLNWLARFLVYTGLIKDPRVEQSAPLLPAPDSGALQSIKPMFPAFISETIMTAFSDRIDAMYSNITNSDKDVLLAQSHPVLQSVSDVLNVLFSQRDDQPIAESEIFASVTTAVPETFTSSILSRSEIISLLQTAVLSLIPDELVIREAQPVAENTSLSVIVTQIANIIAPVTDRIGNIADATQRAFHMLPTPGGVKYQDVSKVDSGDVLPPLEAGFGYETKPLVALDDNLADIYTDPDERQKMTDFTNEELHRIQSLYGVLNLNLPMMKELQKIADDLQQASRKLGKTEGKHQLRVVVTANTKEVNAFALPDGTIVITWAYLKMLAGSKADPSDMGEEATIILHERNHFILDHYKMRNAWATSRSSKLDTEGILRLFEYEGDAGSYEEFIKIGFDPRVHFRRKFQILRAYFDDEGADIPHGTLDERLGALEARLRMFDIQHLIDRAKQNGVQFVARPIPDSWFPISFIPDPLERLHAGAYSSEWVSLFEKLEPSYQEQYMLILQDAMNRYIIEVGYYNLDNRAANFVQKSNTIFELLLESTRQSLEASGMPTDDAYISAALDIRYQRLHILRFSTMAYRLLQEYPNIQYSIPQEAVVQAYTLLSRLTSKEGLDALSGLVHSPFYQKQSDIFNTDVFKEGYSFYFRDFMSGLFFAADQGPIRGSGWVAHSVRPRDVLGMDMTDPRAPEIIYTLLVRARKQTQGVEMIDWDTFKHIYLALYVAHDYWMFGQGALKKEEVAKQFEGMANNFAEFVKQKQAQLGWKVTNDYISSLPKKRPYTQLATAMQSLVNTETFDAKFQRIVDTQDTAGFVDFMSDQDSKKWFEQLNGWGTKKNSIPKGKVHTRAENTMWVIQTIWGNDTILDSLNIPSALKSSVVQSTDARKLAQLLSVLRFSSEKELSVSDLSILTHRLMDTPEWKRLSVSGDTHDTRIVIQMIEACTEDVRRGSVIEWNIYGDFILSQPVIDVYYNQIVQNILSKLYLNPEMVYAAATEISPLSTIYGRRRSHNAPYVGFTPLSAHIVEPVIAKIQEIVQEFPHRVFTKASDASRAINVSHFFSTEAEQKQYRSYVIEQALSTLPLREAVQFMSDMLEGGWLTDASIVQRFIDVRLHLKQDYESIADKVEELYKKTRVEGNNALTGAIEADTMLSQISNSHEAFKMLSLFLSPGIDAYGADDALREQLYIFYIPYLAYSGNVNNYWLEKDSSGHMKVVGPGASSFVNFEEYMEMFYSLTDTQKAYILGKLLMEKGILRTPETRKQLAELLGRSVNSDGENSMLAEALQEALYAVVEVGEPVDISYPIIQLLSPRLFRRPTETNNEILNGRIDIRFFSSEKVQYVFTESDRLDSITQTFLYRKGNVYQELLTLGPQSQQDLTQMRSVTGALLAQYEVASQNYLLHDKAKPQVSKTIKSQPMRSIIALKIVIQSIAGPWLRAAQSGINMAGAVLSREDDRELRDLYDASPAQTKIQLYLNLKQYAKNLKDMYPDMAEFFEHRLIAIDEIIGGGSIQTVAKIRYLDDQGHEKIGVLKVLNPNAETYIGRTTKLTRDMLSYMAGTSYGKRHPTLITVGMKLMNMVESWMIDDINDESYIALDPYFRQTQEFDAASGVRMGVRTLLRPNNKFVKLEDPVPGKTVNAYLKEQSKAPEQIARTRQLVVATIEGYLRMLHRPVVIDGKQDRLMHPDIHAGNVVESTWIDVSLPQHLSEADVRLLLSLSQGSGIQKFTRVVSNFFALPENSKVSKAEFYLRFIWGELRQIRVVFDRVRSGELEDLITSDMLLLFQQMDITYPRSVDIAIKNTGAEDKMAADLQLSPFAAYNEAYEKGPEAFKSFVDQELSRPYLIDGKPVGQVRVDEQQPLATPMPEQTKQRVKIDQTQTGDGVVVPTNSQTEVIISKSTLDVLEAKVRQQPKTEFFAYILRKGSEEKIVYVDQGTSGDGRHLSVSPNVIIQLLRPYITDGYTIVADYHNHPSTNIAIYKAVGLSFEYGISPSVGDLYGDQGTSPSDLGVLEGLNQKSYAKIIAMYDPRSNRVITSAYRILRLPSKSEDDLIEFVNPLSQKSTFTSSKGITLVTEGTRLSNIAMMIAKGIVAPLTMKVYQGSYVSIIMPSPFTTESQIDALTVQGQFFRNRIMQSTPDSDRLYLERSINEINGYIDNLKARDGVRRFEQTVPGPGRLVVVNEARKNWWDKVVRTVWDFIAPRLFLTIPYHSQVVPGQIPSIDYVLGDGGLGVQIHETSPAVTIPVEDHGADFSPMRIVGWAGSIQDAFSRTLSPFFDRGWFKHTQGTLHTWSLPSMGRAYGVTLEESVVSADGTLFPVVLAKGIGAARERIKEWFDVVGTPKDLSEDTYSVIGLAGKKSMIEDGERARVWHKAGMRTRLLYSVSQIKNMLRSFGEEQMDDADAIGVFVVRNPYTFEDVWRVLVPEWYKTTLLSVFVRLSTFRARLFELVYNQAAFLQYEIDPEGKALVTTLVKGDGVGINAWIHWLAKMYGTQSMRKALRGLIGGEDHRQNHGLGVEYRDLSDVAGLPTGHEQEYLDINDPFDARMRAVQAREVMHTLLPILDLHIAANIARSRMWNDGLDDVIGQFIDGLRRENPEYAEQYISEMRVYFTLMSGLGEGLYDMKFTPMILERKNRRIWLGLSSSFLPSSSSVVHDAIMQSLANYQDHMVVPKMSLAESAAQQIIFEYRNKGMTRSSIVRLVREGAVTPQLLAQQVLHFYQPQIRDVLGETEIQYFVRMLEQFFELSDVFQTISEIRIDNTSFANTVGYASYPDQIPATFVIDVRRDNNSFIERSYIQDDQLTRNDIQRLIEQAYALPLVGTGYQGTYEIRWIDANGDNQRFVGSYSMIPNQGMWRSYYQLRANIMRLREEAWNRVQIRSFFGSIMRAVVGDPVPLNEIETQKKAEKEALKEECVGGVSLLTRPFVITEDEQRQQKDNDHEKAISDRGTGKELVSSNHDDLVFSVNQNDKNKLTIPNGRLLSKSLPYSEFEREKSPGLINNTPNHPEERLIKNAANTSANVFFEMGNINFYSTIRKELSSNDWSGLLVKPAYAADQNAPNTPLNCRVFGVFNIKDFNLNRYPGALLWMQKTQRIGQQFQNLFSFLFPKSLNVVPVSKSANVFSFSRISNPTTKDVLNFAGIMGSMDFDVLPNKLQNELLRIVGTWLGRTVSRDQWQLAVDELQNNIEDVQLIPRVKLEPPLLFPLEVVYESADAIEKIPFAKKLFSTTPTLESLSGWFDGRTDLHDDRVIVPIYKATFADGSVERILPVATTRSIGVIQQDLTRVAVLFPPIRVVELSSGHVLVFMRWVDGTKPSTQEVLSFVSSHEDLFLSVSNKYIVRNFDFHELNFVIPTKKAAESMYYVDEDLVLSVIQHGLDEDVTSDKRARYDSANILPLKNELFIEARKQIISQLSSVLPDMIVRSREVALQQNQQLAGEALVTAIIPLIEKMSAYQALTQHVPDGMTQVEFLSLLRPTLKDQIEKVISIKQENDSFLKRLVVKLPIIGKILVTPVVLLLTAISGLLLGWKGSTYFENIGIEGFGAIFRLFPNVIREFMEAIYWPIIMWRLADFGAAIMAMASITAVTELIQRVLSGGMRGISNRIVIINSLLASIIYQLYDLERVAPFFTGKQDYSGYVNYLFHPLIFINDAIQNIIQDPGDTVAMMIGIGLIPIVFYGGLGLAKSVVVAVWKKILSWRRGGVMLLLVGAVALGLLNGTQVQKVVAPIAEVVAAAQDSGCFSYNPFVERVYAAGEDGGTTCPLLLQRPINTLKKIYESRNILGSTTRMIVRIAYGGSGKDKEPDKMRPMVWYFIFLMIHDALQSCIEATNAYVFVQDLERIVLSFMLDSWMHDSDAIAIQDAEKYSPLGKSSEKNPLYRPMQLIINEGIALYKQQTNLPVAWSYHPEYLSTVGVARVFNQPIVKDSLLYKEMINNFCAQKEIDQYVDKPIYEFLFSKKDKIFNPSAVEEACIMGTGMWSLQSSIPDSVSRILFRAGGYAPSLHEDMTRDLWRNVDADYQTLSTQIEEMVQYKHAPISASYVVSYFLEKHSGDLDMALVETADYLKYQSRTALVMEQIENPQIPLWQSANWMKANIKDEYSQYLAYSELPFYSVGVSESEFGAPQDYLYPKDGLLVGNETYFNEAYKDYSLVNRVGGPYHAFNMVSLLHSTSSEMIVAAVIAQHKDQYGLFRWADDLKILSDLPNLEARFDLVSDKKEKYPACTEDDQKNIQ